MSCASRITKFPKVSSWETLKSKMASKMAAKLFKNTLVIHNRYQKLVVGYLFVFFIANVWYANKLDDIIFILSYFVSIIEKKGNISQ